MRTPTSFCLLALALLLSMGSVAADSIICIVEVEYDAPELPRLDMSYIYDPNDPLHNQFRGTAGYDGQAATGTTGTQNPYFDTSTGGGADTTDIFVEGELDNPLDDITGYSSGGLENNNQHGVFIPFTVPPAPSAPENGIRLYRPGGQPDSPLFIETSGHFQNLDGDPLGAPPASATMRLFNQVEGFQDIFADPGPPPPLVQLSNAILSHQKTDTLPVLLHNDVQGTSSHQSEATANTTIVTGNGGLNLDFGSIGTSEAGLSTSAQLVPLNPGTGLDIDANVTLNLGGTGGTATINGLSIQAHNGLQPTIFGAIGTGQAGVTSGNQQGSQLQLPGTGGGGLVNELIIGTSVKDTFNSSAPTESHADFEIFVTNPALAVVIGNVGIQAGLDPFTATDRGDLVAIAVSGLDIQGGTVTEGSNILVQAGSIGTAQATGSLFGTTFSNGDLSLAESNLGTPTVFASSDFLVPGNVALAEITNRTDPLLPGTDLSVGAGGFSRLTYANVQAGTDIANPAVLAAAEGTTTDPLHTVYTVGVGHEVAQGIHRGLNGQGGAVLQTETNVDPDAAPAQDLLSEAGGRPGLDIVQMLNQVTLSVGGSHTAEEFGILASFVGTDPIFFAAGNLGFSGDPNAFLELSLFVEGPGITQQDLFHGVVGTGPGEFADAQTLVSAFGNNMYYFDPSLFPTLSGNAFDLVYTGSLAVSGSATTATYTNMTGAGGVVPEPGALILLVLGGLLLVLRLRRRVG